VFSMTCVGFCAAETACSALSGQCFGQ